MGEAPVLRCLLRVARGTAALLRSPRNACGAPLPIRSSGVVLRAAVYNAGDGGPAGLSGSPHPARLPRAKRPRLSRQDGPGLRRPALDLCRAGGAGGPLRRRAAAGGRCAGRSGSGAGAERAGAAGGALRGVARAGGVGGDQYAAGARRGGLHPEPLGRSRGARGSRAGFQGERGAGASAGEPAAGEPRGSRGRRHGIPPRRPQLGRVRRGSRGGARGRRRRRRGAHYLHQLHVGHHGAAQGRDVHTPRHVSQRAGRGRRPQARGRAHHREAPSRARVCGGRLAPREVGRGCQGGSQASG
jgi:hypothetical protein